MVWLIIQKEEKKKEKEGGRLQKEILTRHALFDPNKSKICYV
jgi:hypothetical protein